MKIMIYIALCLYILAVVCYVSSLLVTENKTLLMVLGSAAMCFGTILTIKYSSKEK